MVITKELYEDLAMQFFKDNHRNYDKLKEGLLEEAREVCESEDLDNLVEELGDVLWYVTIMLKNNGSSIDSAMKKNIAKLERRELNGKS